MRALGIETSCDETGVAVYDDCRGLLSNRLHSQIALHADYGGVVPELASRDHIRKVIPLVKEALTESNSSSDDIDVVAYTAGPGLVGALLVGATTGRSLAMAWKKPAVAVHHMEGHLMAPMLENDVPQFPFLALLVSGGHTMIVRADCIGRYQILGESIDDAVGEAFDKTAKLIGLDYPGGRFLSELAELGCSGRFTFPRPMIDRPSLDMSFSGLKTFAANTIADNTNDRQTQADIALAFEQAVVDTLVVKCSQALDKTGFHQLVISGGVSANRRLQSTFTELMSNRQGKVFYPRTEFCTDNGAMIAYAGLQRFKAGQSQSLSVKTTPRWPLDELPSLG